MKNREAVTTEDRENAIRLLELEERFRSLFERVPVGLYRTTADGKLVEANQAQIEILGFEDLDAYRRANIADLYVDRSVREALLSELEAKGTVQNFEMQLRRADGKTIWVRNSVRAVRDSSGAVQFMEGMLEDITEQRRNAAKVRRLQQRLVEAQAAEAAKLRDEARRDSLTGLSNRIGFEERLADLLALENRPLSAVMFIDLNGFKSINDSLGHGAGDEVLVIVAGRI